MDGVNQFLKWLPEDADPKPALRLGMMILEAADVAPQAELAQAAGFGQARSVRCCLDSLSTEYFVPVYFDLQDKASASLGRLLYELSVAISQTLGPVIAGFIWYPFERFGHK